VSLVGRPAENHPQQTKMRGALETVDDRRTPRDLWDDLQGEFGFDLDVAASADNSLCERYYTLEDDGLAKSWADSRVWCNPPYSACEAWVGKAWQEWTRIDHPPVIVMLLPANRTEQRWWQAMIEPERDGRGAGVVTVRFLPGRMRFDVPAGTYSDPRGNRPPFGVCLVIWGANAASVSG
jgi:phage N-6-adenine-methyltransferase